MKKIKIIGFLSLSLIFCLSIVFLTYGESADSVIIWDKPFMNAEEAKEISRFKVAIIDVENHANNPLFLSLIKNTNPQIKLLASINLTGVKMPIGVFRPIQREFIRRIGRLKINFLLKDDHGGLISDPHENGVYVFNISSASPLKAQNISYIDFAADFYSSSVFSSPNSFWNGLVLEQSWNKIIEKAILFKSGQDIGFGDLALNIDADEDGEADEIIALAMSWRKGADDFIELIKERQGESFVAVK